MKNHDAWDVQLGPEVFGQLKGFMILILWIKKKDVVQV